VTSCSGFQLLRKSASLRVTSQTVFQCLQYNLVKNVVDQYVGITLTQSYDMVVLEWRRMALQDKREWLTDNN
jgi:hypothetical protein